MCLYQVRSRIAIIKDDYILFQSWLNKFIIITYHSNYKQHSTIIRKPNTNTPNKKTTSRRRRFSDVRMKSNNQFFPGGHQLRFKKLFKNILFMTN